MDIALRRFTVVVFVALTAAASCLAQGNGAGAGPQGAGGQNAGGRGAQAPPLLIAIPAFPDGGDVPDKFSCTSVPPLGDPHLPGSLSPEISWSQAPPGTQSFLVLVHDPEPHPGKGVTDNTHWLIWNIPATATGLPEGVLPGGTLPDGSHQLKGNGNNAIAGYRGPCAPPGPDHHYTWELWALDAMLHAGENATRADVMKEADGHILGVAIWIGMFHRTQ